MQNFLTTRSRSLNLSYHSTIKLVAFYFATTQVLTVFRATAIYNTSYIANFLRLLISGMYILLFIRSFPLVVKRVTLLSLTLILAPLIGLIIGYINGQFGRDYFSDFYTAFAFATIVIHYKNNPQSITRNDFEYLARCELIATIFSLLTYKLFPLIGYPIKSVGIVSNYLLFPLAYYLSYKNKLWLVTALTILFGGKRGVMISAIAVFCYFYFFDKRRSVRSFIVVILAGVFLSAGIYFTTSPARIAMLPTALQRVAVRFMKVNPFSDQMDLHSDGRLDEIEGALEKFSQNPMNFLVGNGNGFAYDMYHEGELRYENRHNVHFTPVSLLTRYGVIYTTIFYLDYLWLMFKATKYIRAKREHKFIMCCTLYLVGSFVDQFTVFLPYSDYQFMICFGMLNGFFLCHCDCDEEINYDIKPYQAIQ